jgi:outer membrane protein assembly factor BamA
MKTFVFLLLMLFSTAANAQMPLIRWVDSLLQSDLRFLPAPILYRTPETSWGLGASMGYYFKTDTLNTRTSNAQFQVVRTFNRQTLLRMSVDLFTPNEKVFIHAYTGYRNYVDQFYGIGPEALESDMERYSYRAWINAWSVLGKLGPGNFAGLNLRHLHMYDVSTEAGGLLASGAIQGGNGSHTLGFGPEWLLDQRDNVMSPVRGHKLQLFYRWHPAMNAANPAFETFFFDFRHYQPLSRKVIWASRTLMQFQRGNPPFRELGLAGGSEFVRGYFQGRYRDKQLAGIETELRMPVWKMFGATVFASSFQVAPDAAGLLERRWRGAYGAGLRFFVNQQERIVLRLDIARTTEGHLAFYLDLNESF